MGIQSQRMQPETQIRLGMIALGVASLVSWFLPRTGLVSEDWVDGIRGLLYGAAIAWMLLGIWRSRKRSDRG